MINCTTGNKISNGAENLWRISLLLIKNNNEHLLSANEFTENFVSILEEGSEGSKAKINSQLT